MSEEQICCQCQKHGTKIISRCGHILHESCFEIVVSNMLQCPKCGIKLSWYIEFESLFVKVKLSQEIQTRVDNELIYNCLEKILLISEKSEDFEDGLSIEDDVPYDDEILTQLYKIGWDINDERFGGPNLFFHACKFGDLIKLNLLINHGIDLDKYGQLGMKYSSSGALVFDQLLQLGVQFEYEIIIQAIARNNFEMLKRLVEEGVDVNLKGKNDMRPIHAAAIFGYVEMIKYLIDNGADISAADRNGKSILHYASMLAYGKEIFEYLLDSGVDLEIRCRNGETPLLVAITERNDTVAEFLIEKKAGINKYDYCLDTPLHRCASEGNFGLMKILIQNGADVNARNMLGRTPIFSAVLSKSSYFQFERINILVNNGANFDALDKLKNRPIDYINDNELIQKLIDAGITKK